MGQQATKSAKVVGQRWNAENRAYKVLENNKIKPTPAPHHVIKERESTVVDQHTNTSNINTNSDLSSGTCMNLQNIV